MILFRNYMDYVDIHTHQEKEGKTILNCYPHEFCPKDGRWYSVGIHPWYVSGASLTDDFEKLKECACHPQVLALGECGLDKRSETDMDLQAIVFERQIELSEEIQKPMILHVVHVYNEIIRLRKEMKPRQPWIIHGFRGKAEIAAQLLRVGFYLSFGEHFSLESLHTIPLDRLFIETDESLLPIEGIYSKVAEGLSITSDILEKRIEENSSLFWK